MLKRSKLARVGIKRAIVQPGRKPIKRAVGGSFKPSKGISKLKKELDRLFSLYIRAKYKKECYTCGLKSGKLQCGHFVTRQYLATRWDERNCRPQCSGCNIWGKGKVFDFEENLKKELGAEVVEELKNSRHQTLKLKEPYYLENIAKYKALVVIHTQTLGQ